MADTNAKTELDQILTQQKLFSAPPTRDPEEMQGNGLIGDTNLVNPITKTLTPSGEHLRAVQGDKISTPDLLGYGVTTNNTIYDVAATVAVDLGSTDEDGFNPNEVPGLFDGIPAEYRAKLARTDSTVEAWATRARIEEYMQNNEKLASAGWRGTGAQIAAGIIDADALLIPVSGGTWLGSKAATSLAKVGIKDSRLANTVVGAAAGLEAGAVTSITGATLGTTTDEGDIPASILSGMGFGSTIGALHAPGSISPYKQMETAQKAHDEYVSARNGNFQPAYTVQAASGSVGSAQVRRVDTPDLRESSKPWFDRAADDTNALNARDVLQGKADSDTTNVDSLVGRAAQKAQNWIDKSPLKSLYSSVANMGVIGNKLAYDLLYHPGGIIDRSTPAAGYDALYTQELSLPVQNYHSLAMQFLDRPTTNIKEKVKNAFIKQDQYNTFNSAVRWELESRYHDGAGNPDVHPAVKEMADQLDTMHKRAIDIQKGMAGETPVHGSDILEHKPGYYTRRWDGEAMQKFNERDIIAALRDGYTKLLPPGSVIDQSAIESIVKSIVTRAKAMDEGIDTNLIGLLRDNGKEFLRDTLKNNKLSDEQINKVLDTFVGNAEERSKPGFLKNRIELDLRTPIGNTGNTLLDLLQPDLYKSTHMYTRKVAGTSALARKGYQLGDKTSIIESIKDELQASGQNVKDPRIEDMLNTTFSYFGAGAVGGGVDPLLLSAMRLTRQSLLGSLGLTQLSELGGLVSMVGVEAAIKTMPSEMRAIMSGKKTPLVQELHDAFIFLDKDHVLYDDRLALDIVGQDSIVQSAYVDGAHRAIAYGDKIAGYTSLFYQAMTFSQRLAMSSVNHKLYKTLSKDALDAGVSRRLLDLGLDENMTDALQKYINKGTIQMKDGELTMNFDKWNPADLQDYKLAMNTFVARAVQKNLPGETPYWATKQFGQFATQLRMYPIQALQKQFLRNMRHADATTASALLWNLGVAGIIYSVSQTVKGKGDELTPEKIAKGALNYSPTTGWLPMATDPIAEIMGLPELKMNKFGPPGRATDGIIPIPPAIPTLNRMLHLPGAAIGSLNGIDRNESASLSSIPIIGNTYGFSALFNHLKDTADKDEPDVEPEPTKEIPEIQSDN